MGVETVDVAVLGLGGMGSATALSLALRGIRVAGFEQYGVAHQLGSSHGDVRIIRKAYFEHPDYVPLLEEAYELWDGLEKMAEKELLVPSGVLLTGPAGSETIRGLEACYAENALPHERLRQEELGARWPLFRFPEDHEGFFDPHGGYLYVEDCVEQALLMAQRHGAELHLHEAVLEWRANGSGVEIVTDKRTLQAGALVITAGPWSNPQMLGLSLPLQVVRKVQLWYQFPGVEQWCAPEVPAYYIERPYGSVYGFPFYGGHGLKLAEHTGGDPVAGPAEVDRSLKPEDETVVRRFLAEIFDQPSPELKHFSVCMYTRTPDENFILDTHPEHPQVCFAAGFSGHGFKFAPVIGEIMADLALDNNTDRPIDFLRAARFRESAD